MYGRRAAHASVTAAVRPFGTTGSGIRRIFNRLTGLSKAAEEETLETYGTAIYILPTREPPLAPTPIRRSPGRRGVMRGVWRVFKTPFSQSAASDPDTIEFEAFAEAVDAGDVAVVDVREPHEFAAGHIPEAVNLPLSRFDPEELPSDKPLILICQAAPAPATR